MHLRFALKESPLNLIRHQRKRRAVVMAQFKPEEASLLALLISVWMSPHDILRPLGRGDQP